MQNDYRFGNILNFTARVIFLLTLINHLMLDKAKKSRMKK